MTTTVDNTAKLIRNPKGANSRTVPINTQLDMSPAMGGEGIPDLWHYAQAMPEIAEILKTISEGRGLISADDELREDDEPTAKEIEKALSAAGDFGPLCSSGGTVARENILDAWHLAHDLKKRVQAMSAALQPIIDLLGRVESGETQGASGCYAADESGETALSRVIVPVELLREVRAIHTGVKL